MEPLRELQAKPCTNSHQLTSCPGLSLSLHICALPCPHYSLTSQALTHLSGAPPTRETFSSNIYQSTSCSSVTTSLHRCPALLAVRLSSSSSSGKTVGTEEGVLVTAHFQMRRQRQREQEEVARLRSLPLVLQSAVPLCTWAPHMLGLRQEGQRADKLPWGHGLLYSLRELSTGGCPPRPRTSHLEELEIWKASGHPGQLVIVQVQLPQRGQKTQAPILYHSNLVVA